MSATPMNTDHDEALIRRTWTGEEWLGLDSLRAPRHGAPRDLRELRGTYTTTDREAGYAARRTA